MYQSKTRQNFSTSILECVALQKLQLSGWWKELKVELNWIDYLIFSVISTTMPATNPDTKPSMLGLFHFCPARLLNNTMQHEWSQQLLLDKFALRFLEDKHSTYSTLSRLHVLSPGWLTVLNPLKDYEKVTYKDYLELQWLSNWGANPISAPSFTPFSYCH